MVALGGTVIVLSFIAWLVSIVLAISKTNRRRGFIVWGCSILALIVGGALAASGSHQPPSDGNVQHHVARKAKSGPSLSEDAIEGRELSDLSAAVKLLNSSSAGQLVTKVGVGESSATLTVDADTFDDLSDQDKRLMYSTMEKAYAVTYRQHHSGKIATNLSFRVDDLSGASVYDDMIYPDS